jgi:carboxypeptidase T
MKKQYSTYQQTCEFLANAMREYPHLIQVNSIGETWEKRPIMMATISNDVSNAGNKPALLYTGSIHAREWIGNELAIKFIQYIIDNHQYHPMLASALNSSSLYIVPCLNPDGFEYSHTHFSFWRKNRRDNGDNTFGVDLNRNFGVRFKKGTDTSSAIYSGPAAFSEPETQAIKVFVETHPNIRIALDYHSQGNVFFPAHKFNHEKEIEGTDLNVLCANMNNEIRKVTGREYGIHRGKPPFNLIHGSGREYYYARGIMSIVVEVGSRNIPDYLQYMAQSIDENIPALLLAFRTVRNYVKEAPPRIENFNVTDITTDSVSLSWDGLENKAIYFEIFRSDTSKSACSRENLIAITHSCEFTDIQLKSGQMYYYNLHAIDPSNMLNSPFSPEIRLKTRLAPDEFSRALLPAKSDIGYLSEYSLDANKKHFGRNSMFIGVSNKKGICFGLIAFSLKKLSPELTIKSAIFSLYPMNRVGAKIETYGEWSISILDVNTLEDISDFNQVKNAVPLLTLGQTIESDHLRQGIWKQWHFNGVERALLQNQINSGRILFRIQGPNKLPLGQKSQLMQFDIGYGPFGGGVHYRPFLDIIYRAKPTELRLTPVALNTISMHKIDEDCLSCGFDREGGVVYGQMAFTLDQLPDPEETVITDAHLIMQNKNSINTNKDIRFTIELAELKDLDYVSVKNRQKIEFIGYEISNTQLKKSPQHHLIFDSYCRQDLERLHSEGKPVYFIIRPTAISQERDAIIDWSCNDKNNKPSLMINYVTRRKNAVSSPTNLSITIENSLVKLSWDNPEDKDFIGCYVVRNCFHPPMSPFDGVKLYAGKDQYTYDKYGNANITKYYSVFSYDVVPNYSKPASICYNVTDTFVVNEDFIDFDHFDEMLSEYENDDGDIE